MLIIIGYGSIVIKERRTWWCDSGVRSDHYISQGQEE